MTLAREQPFDLPAEAGAPAHSAVVAPPGDAVEVTIVMPCLNEADTVATCVSKAVRALAIHQIRGEVLVADNGSTDGSIQLAEQAGARVVHVSQRGYGAALQGGIAAARGRYIIMGDADDSYDFGEIPRFVEQLRNGYELVQGCRLPSGGGRILPGAMPISHRWIGNPMLSMLVRWWFDAPVHDVYCGLRGFSVDLYQRLKISQPGMEFATEMILSASRLGARVTEVPITLHPDGRKAHPPHLRTLRDGWRTLRLFMLNCPRWVFLEPGKLLILLGLIGYALSLPGLTLAGIEFGLNTLVYASLALMLGEQSILFAVGGKTLGDLAFQRAQDPRMTRLFRFFTVERVVIAGTVAHLAGLLTLAGFFFYWSEEDFGHLNYETSLRVVIPAATLTAIGFQTLLAGFFLGALSAVQERMDRRQTPADPTDRDS